MTEKNDTATPQLAGDEEQLRREILQKVREYARLRFGRKRFVPGQSLVHYAGRVMDEEELALMADSVLDTVVTLGRYGLRLEAALAKFIGVKSAFLVNSGSSANLLAFSALLSPNLEGHLLPGDEVVTPAATFPTTLAPVLQRGCVPVFVDVELDTLNADASRIEAAIGPRTRAIFMAHTLGNPYELDVVADIAKRRGLWLIEDCCDALGSRYDGKMVGTFGDLATLSCYPAHHMTMGEGGAVFTDREDLAKIVLAMRDWGRDCWCAPGKSNTCGKRFDWKVGALPHGYDHKYIYSEVGFNLKPTDIQAALGVAQIEKLPSFIEARRRNFDRLYACFRRHEDHFVLPRWSAKAEPSWFALPLTVRENAPFSRSDFIQHLEAARIETRQIFAGNILRQPAFMNIPHRIAGTLENTDAVMNRSFFIGVYPGLTEEQLQHVERTVARFYEK